MKSQIANPKSKIQKNPAAVALGRLGGAATKGIKKKNGTALARRAANARWRAYRAAKKAAKKGT